MNLFLLRSRIHFTTLRNPNSVVFYQAIGIQGSENGAVTVTTKKPGNPQHPGKNEVTVTYGPRTATRK